MRPLGAEERKMGLGFQGHPQPLYTQAQMGIKQEKHQSADSAGIVVCPGKVPFPLCGLDSCLENGGCGSM